MIKYRVEFDNGKVKDGKSNYTAEEFIVLVNKYCLDNNTSIKSLNIKNA